MVCRSSGNMTMKHGVDIVRSALQALHTHAAGTESRQQCCGNCSFSGAAADCTDQQPWNRSLHVQMLLSQIGYTFIISYLLMLFKCHTGLVKNSFFSGSLTSRYFYDMIGATSKSYNLCTILKSIPHILQNVFQIH